MTEPAAEFAEVHKVYETSSETVHALRGIEISFARGAVTAVVGPSGSGKSSLLRILGAMDRPSSGSVEIDGVWASHAGARTLRKLRRRIGFVFQRPSDNLISYLSLLEHMQLAARLRKRTEREIHPILESLGLEALVHSVPEQLSGGEQQRLAFAQSMIGAPTLVVADEPTAELDSHSSARLHAVLRTIADEGAAVVIATHDRELVAAADAVIPLRHGVIEGRPGMKRT